jgi:hypothetical protein
VSGQLSAPTIPKKRRIYIIRFYEDPTVQINPKIQNNYYEKYNHKIVKFIEIDGL